MDEEWTAPRDAAERDARLRALPGGRQAWLSSVVMFVLTAAATVFLVVQGALTGAGGFYGLAVMSGTFALAIGLTAWVGRAARRSTAGGPSRTRVLAWAALWVAALGAFVLGATAGSGIGALWYLAGAALAFAAYRSLRSTTASSRRPQD